MFLGKLYRAPLSFCTTSTFIHDHTWELPTTIRISAAFAGGAAREVVCSRAHRCWLLWVERRFKGGSDQCASYEYCRGLLSFPDYNHLGVICIMSYIQQWHTDLWGNQQSATIKINQFRWKCHDSKSQWWAHVLYFIFGVIINIVYTASRMKADSDREKSCLFCVGEANASLHGEYEIQSPVLTCDGHCSSLTVWSWV